jgi:hypoxanthine-DNA glycosylase
LLLVSFDPIIAPDSTVLILGSMPGRESLRQGQYYAHSRNLFWRIMSDLVGVDPAAPYDERVRQLLDAGIALWDSLLYCERPASSLDADIRSDTEVPNDFKKRLADNPGIRAIGFNGKKSEQVFRKHVLPKISDAQIQKIDLICLPSTSPANASLTYGQKLSRWRVILDYLPNVSLS